MCHALYCKRGGLVVACHNKLQDGVADLAGRAFILSHVRVIPLISSSCSVKRPKAKPARTTDTTDWYSAPLPEATEQKGYLLIRDLWQNGTNIVHDMRVVNTDTKSHSGKTLDKCLQEAGRVKKRMYLEA